MAEGTKSKSTNNYQWYLWGFFNSAESWRLKEQKLYEKRKERKDINHVAQKDFKCEASFSPDYITVMHWEARKGIKDIWQAKDKEIQFSS